MEVSPQFVPCLGCGASVPDEDGPVHAYVGGSPGCWRIFGEVQADELMRFQYPTAHGWVVDAYMAQHPGDGSDRRDRQSVYVHLLALCLRYEIGAPDRVRGLLMGRATKGLDDFPVLPRATSDDALTVLSMVGARDLDDYTARAQRWGASVWASHAASHQLIRDRLTTLGY